MELYTKNIADLAYWVFVLHHDFALYRDYGK